MNRDFVLDSSVTLTWFFPDESSEQTDALLDNISSGAKAVVPGHWFLEVTNVLVCAERKRTTPAKTSAFLEWLLTLKIEQDNETSTRAPREVLSLARAHGLTTYDAAYLELAMRRGLPLATLDRDLRIAATKSGVMIIPSFQSSTD